MRQKRLSNSKFRLTPRTIYAAVALAAAASLYLFHLGRFIGQAPAETQTAAASATLGTLAANPLNLPYKALEYMALQIPFGSAAFQGRLPSVMLALACGLFFYLLVQRWHGTRNAVLSTTLFVASSWMLQTGRFGASLVLLTATVLGLLVLAAWCGTTEPRARVAVWTALAVSVVLFVPAGIWFLLAAGFAVRKQLPAHIAQAGKARLAAAAALPAIALLIIGTAIVRDPDLLRQWLGLPAELPMYIMIVKHAAASLLFIIGRGPFMPEVWLAHTPILDAALTVMLLLGTAFYAKRRNNTRVWLLAAFTAISIILIALNGPPALAYLVPLVYLVAATGLSYLLHQWLQVFPRNPFARYLALSLVIVLTACTVSFHVQRYFIAWRNSPDTAEAYRSNASDLQGSNLIQ